MIFPTIPGVPIASLVDSLALLITCLSGYFVYRQRTPLYLEVKTLLIYVHIFFGSVTILEIMRNFVSATNIAYMDFYTIMGMSFVLWDVLLLMTVAAAVYLRPEGRGLGKLLVSITRQKDLGTIYIATALFVIGSDFYLAILRPFKIITVVNLVGVSVPSILFDPIYLAIVTIVLFIFLSFPATLFLLARRKTRDKEVRRAFLLLPIVWATIGVDLIIFNGVLLSRGIDYIAVGYSFAAISFLITALLFRRTSLLSGFFAPVEGQPITLGAPVYPFSSSIGIDHDSLLGKNFLYMLDSSRKFEGAVDDFAMELLSNKHSVFVFTSRRSPVHDSVSKINGLRYVILTPSVSYPKETDVPFEILAPQNDHAILLDMIQKIISGDPRAEIGIVYDSISDMILSSSLESCYKFLKQANEIISSSNRAVALFLFNPAAHDEREGNLVKTLFTNHVVYGTNQPILAR
ncbi:MAG: hypothetical protein ACYCPW_06955 [Nitrososphaerales archaeon]